METTTVTAAAPVEMPPADMVAEGMPEEVAAFVGHVLEVARSLVRDEGFLDPIAFVASWQKSTMIQVMMDFSTSEAKAKSAAVVRKVAGDVGADMVLIISEGWQLPSHLMKNHRAILERYGSIGACPDRIEVVQVL